jgi:hypothetical protein
VTSHTFISGVQASGAGAEAFGDYEDYDHDVDEEAQDLWRTDCITSIYHHVYPKQAGTEEAVWLEIATLLHDHLSNTHSLYPVLTVGAERQLEGTRIPGDLKNLNKPRAHKATTSATDAFHQQMERGQQMQHQQQQFEQQQQQQQQRQIQQQQEQKERAENNATITSAMASLVQLQHDQAMRQELARDGAVSGGKAGDPLAERLNQHNAAFVAQTITAAQWLSAIEFVWPAQNGQERTSHLQAQFAQEQICDAHDVRLMEEIDVAALVKGWPSAAARRFAWVRAQLAKLMQA